MCEHCKTETVLTKEQAALLNRENLEGSKVFEKKGCLYCGGSGHNGRVAVFELLKITDTFKSLIRTDLNDDSLRAEMKRLQIPTLKDDAVAKMLNGTISFEDCYKTLSAI